MILTGVVNYITGQSQTGPVFGPTDLDLGDKLRGKDGMGSASVTFARF